MSELGNELTHGRIGRVPVWAVGVGLAGAFVAFMYWRNRHKPADGGGPADTSGTAAFDPNVDTSGAANYGLPQGAIGDFLASDPTNPAFPVGLSSNGIPAPITNIQWSRLSFDYLIGQGNDPSLVETALAKYINGQSLSAAERSIVNLAQTHFGAPPEGLILGGVTVTPTPPPVDTSTSTTPKQITVQAGTQLYAAAGSAGLTGAQFAALNPTLWATNTRWGTVRDENGNLPPYAIKTAVYKTG